MPNYEHVLPFNEYLILSKLLILIRFIGLIFVSAVMHQDVW